MGLDRKTEKYWVYNNWTVEQGGKAIIHRASCPFCMSGKGLNRTGPTTNGKWYGPFRNKQDALSKANDTGAKRVACCKHCNP